MSSTLQFERDGPPRRRANEGTVDKDEDHPTKHGDESNRRTHDAARGRTTAGEKRSQNP
jgi:hypothetical protein